MKKFGLLPLIAAFMLFGSGLALAKIYWLPDYLGDNMSRSTDDDSNRTAGCSKGGYYNSPLGSGYNCSRVVYAHQACYSCTAKSCPSGYTAGLTKCADKTGYSASYSSNGISGTQTCGKCDYKKLPCASGYSTNYQSVNNCGTSKDKGWTFTSKGYSGEKKCGRCDPKPASNCAGKVTSVSGCGARGASGWKLCSSSPSCYAGDTPYYDCCALSCNSPYAAGVTSCSPSNGHTWKQDKDRYNGDTVCGYCETKSCPNNEMTQTTCYAKTNGSNGWIWKGTSNYTGATQCGTCTAKTCDNSYQTAASTCGTTGASGWTINTGNKCYAGATTKYKCTAKTCASEVKELAALNENAVLGWRFWAAFLGLGYLSGTMIIPNMKLRLEDILATTYTEKFKYNETVIAQDFILWLSTKIPEVEIGSNLPLALSAGLRTLHEIGLIKLETWSDSTPIMLYYVDGDPINGFTHISVKEAMDS